jgi:hypothetical protein
MIFKLSNNIQFEEKKKKINPNNSITKNLPMGAFEVVSGDDVTQEKITIF